MKKDKIIFWVTTGLVGIMMLFSAFNYLTNEEMKGAFVHLGFPNYFRIELAVAKILGAAALLLPGIPVRIKEFAYSGFTIVFISAFIAHLAVGDAFPVSPLIFLAMLFVSFIYFHKIRKMQRVV
jgi:hypothetical protein